MALSRGAPRPSSHPASNPEEASLYLDLMKRTLSGWVYADANVLTEENLRGQDRDTRPFDPHLREQGADWPETAETMIGLQRLDNLQACVEDALANGVPGDLIETGVWRGGATILMRAVLKAYGVEDRRVWVADSFEGVPPPDPETYPQDKDNPLHTYETLAVSIEQVQANFERYGLLDGQVHFLEGWFRDTLPEAPIETLAVVRLDGDMYESTMDALVNLYPKLSVGGYLIVDDYGAIPTCRQAVHDYRETHGITDEIQPIDWSGVFWQRSGE
ncbi:MAG: TylF/MycF family methyltransferase [Actinobacteria bacterium]|nr:TylF/MycF family methyltransferase [Actinomycetota bacterium]